MIRLLCLATATAMVAGCGTIDCDENTFTCTGDDRPATLEYVTETILRPNCANAQCHSEFRYAGYLTPYRFDTLDHTAQSISDGFLVDTSGFDPDVSLLYGVLVRDTLDTPIGGSYFPRMPYDQPLPVADIALIRRWISEGADGLVAP